MESREPINMEELELGNILLKRNPKKNITTELNSRGLALFVQYVDDGRMSALIYNLKTKRMTRARISNLAPFRTV